MTMVWCKNWRFRWFVCGICSLLGVHLLILMTWSLTNTQAPKTFGSYLRRYMLPNIKTPRVLCLILTTTDSIEKRSAVNSTWAQRCDKTLFVVGRSSDKQDASKPTSENESDFLLVDTPETRRSLPQKVRLAFDYAYHRYNDSFDWIMKCDDDTYVIMDNLKRLLSKYKSSEPGYIGFRMKVIVQGGYMSGGAGYLLSYAGLRALVKNGNQPNCHKLNGDEDVELGKCFQKVGIPVLDSWDENGKETFHPEPLEKYLYPPYPTWLDRYAWKKPAYGPGCCSRHSISFHHLKPSDMFVYEHLLYNTTLPRNAGEK